MSTPTYTLAVTERDEAVHGFFTTALEGGIGYWSQCSEYRWSDGTPEHNPVNEFRAVVTDVEDGEDTEYVIDAAVVRRGLRRLHQHFIDLGAKANPYHRQAVTDFTFGNYDDLDYDADTADLVVQLGLFGEVRYN